jgi:hypothetical protein
VFNTFIDKKMDAWGEIAASNLEQIISRIPEPLRPAFRAAKISKLSPMAPLSAGIVDTANKRDEVFSQLPADVREEIARYDYPEWRCPPLDSVCAKFCDDYKGASYAKLEKSFEIPSESFDDLARSRLNLAVGLLNEL